MPRTRARPAMLHGRGRQEPRSDGCDWRRNTRCSLRAQRRNSRCSAKIRRMTQRRRTERTSIPQHDRLRPNRLCRSPTIATIDSNASHYGHCHAIFFAPCHQQTSISAPSGYGRLRQSSPVSGEGAFAFPAYHPPPRAAPDRAPGRDNDLRVGAARRIPAPIPPYCPLRRMGPGGSRSLDRKPQASLSISGNRHCAGSGREAAPESPSSVTTPSDALLRGIYPDQRRSG